MKKTGNLFTDACSLSAQAPGMFTKTNCWWKLRVTGNITSAWQLLISCLLWLPTAVCSELIHRLAFSLSTVHTQKHTLKGGTQLLQHFPQPLSLPIRRTGEQWKDISSFFQFQFCLLPKEVKCYCYQRSLYFCYVTWLKPHVAGIWHLPIKGIKSIHATVSWFSF